MNSAIKKTLFARPALSFLLFALSLMVSCQSGPRKRVESGKYMGTVVEITAYHEDKQVLKDAVSAAFQEIERVEEMMSSYRKDSDISRINSAAGKRAVKVDPEVTALVWEALILSSKSEGAFDITFAAMKGVWDFDPASPHVPSDEEIKERLELVGYDQVEVQPHNSTVFLEKEGMRIGLGGIAKGYAVDKAIQVLQKKGIKMAIVNAGGDLRVMGGKPGGPWLVGIKHPRKSGELVATVEINDGAMATSGDYEKFIYHEGKRLPHIMDPRTGKPALGMMSVTVFTDRAWLADGLATSIFVEGPGSVNELLDHYGKSEAVIIDSDGQRNVTGGLGARIHWLDEAK